MIPSRPVEVTSQAEVKAFGAFSEALGDGWVVAHSVRWLFKSRRGGPRPPEEREADFLIANPEFGALIVEVKGGEIRYDAASGRWVSRSRGGDVHEIKDPTVQAQSAVHSLLRCLEEHPGVSSTGALGYSVAFPDGQTAGPLPASLPDDLVLDAGDFLDPDKLRLATERAARYWGGKGRGEWTRASLNAVVDFVSHDFEIRAPLSLALDEADREIIRLSESQFRLLDQLGRNPRVAVAGCAGSGKTLLAAEQASRLARAGHRTLLVCYNRPLADYLRVRVPQVDGLEVMNFHQVCSALTKQAGVRVGAEESETFWSDDMPEALVEAASKLGPRYDAIVADEGQDFAESWWLALLTLLEDPDRGTFYVFYDDNQVLYDRPRDLPDGMFDFQLTENWRNTKQIHSFIERFYEGAPVTPLGPDGPEVEVVSMGKADLAEAVREQLDRLVGKEGVAPSDIVVLVPGSTEHNPVSGKLGQHLLTESPKGRRDIRLSSVRRFKGLEAKVVIIAGAGPDDPGSRELMYVASSRARAHLLVVGT